MASTPATEIGATQIADTYAEAFGVRYARIIITAIDAHWVTAATRELCGYGTSVIKCDAEIAVERLLAPNETPDGRPGAAVLAFGFAADPLGKALVNRVGQCVMTCPTTAVFDALPVEPVETAPLGKQLRFFGDGYQKSKLIEDFTPPSTNNQASDDAASGSRRARRFWRIPVMDGEFLVEESIGIARGVAGGNIILQGIDQRTALDAAMRVVDALASLPGVVTPFPGGVVRSGSKVGSRYKGLVASSNQAFCPTLRGRVETELVDAAQCAYEIVFNGTDEPTVAAATTAALHAAAGAGIPAISAGNYGGKLGKFHFHLRELV